MIGSSTISVATNSIPLDKAVSLAVENSYLIKSYEKELNVIEYNIQLLEQKNLPEVNVHLGANTQIDSNTDITKAFGYFSIKYNFLKFLKSNSGIAKELKDKEVHTLSKNIARAKISKDLKDLYYKIAYIKELNKALEEKKHAIQVLAKVLLRKVNSGFISKTNLKELDLEKFHTNHEIIENNDKIKNIKSKIILNTGIAKTSDEVVFDTSLPSFLDLDQTIQNVQKNQNNFSLANTLNFKQNKIQLFQKDIQLEQIKKDLYPKIYFEASYGYLKINESLAKNENIRKNKPEGSAAIGINWNIISLSEKKVQKLKNSSEKEIIMDRAKSLQQKFSKEILDIVNRISETNHEIEFSQKYSKKMALFKKEITKEFIKKGLHDFGKILELIEKMAEERSKALKNTYQICSDLTTLELITNIKILK